MAKTSSSLNTKATSWSSNRDGDGNKIYNELLLGLIPKDTKSLTRPELTLTVSVTSISPQPIKSVHQALTVGVRPLACDSN